MIRMKDLKNKILAQTPFSENEFTDDIFNLSIEYALDILSGKVYKTVNGSIEELKSKYGNNITICTVNNSRLEDASFGYTITDMNDFAIDRMHKGARVDAFLPIELEDLYGDNAKFRNYTKYFEQLIVGKSMMLMANKRRSVDMSSLPFDMKGDAFYDQGKTICDDTIAILSNMTPNFY